jgi:ribonucleoside-diphosphate reductase alpha chain
MLKLSQKVKINEISEKPANHPYTVDPKSIRPDVVDAKVYKLKSAFIKNSVFITMSYIKHEDQIRPIEIFINSKDLTRAPEYVVLTRLISAIFRRSPNPLFILEELQGIFDPNGGSFKEGKYYHSFYAEIADVIEKFFYDVDILEKPNTWNGENDGDLATIDSPPKKKVDNDTSENASFKICPDCGAKALKTENGCDSCMACGYSKCDK